MLRDKRREDAKKALIQKHSQHTFHSDVMDACSHPSLSKLLLLSLFTSLTPVALLDVNELQSAKHSLVGSSLMWSSSVRCKKLSMMRKTSNK